MTERRTMPSGAEVHVFPPQNPDLWDDEEHFYAFPDCEECNEGREMIKNEFGFFFVQCVPCWSRHYDHPETQRVHKEQLQALNEGTNEVDHYFTERPKGTP